MHIKKENILELTPYTLKTEERSYMVGAISLSQPFAYHITRDKKPVLTIKYKKAYAKELCGLFNGAYRSGVLEAINCLENNYELDKTTDMYELDTKTGALLYEDDTIYTFVTQSTPAEIKSIVAMLNLVQKEAAHAYYRENQASNESGFNY